MEITQFTSTPIQCPIPTQMAQNNQSTQQILSAAQYVPVYPTMQSSQQIDFDKFVSDVFIRFNHSDLQLFSCLFVKIFLFPYKSIEDEVLITVIQ